MEISKEQKLEAEMAEFKKMLDRVAKGEKVESPQKFPDDYTCDELKVPIKEAEGAQIEIPMLYIKPKNLTSKKVIFLMHGGGFEQGLIYVYKFLAVKYSKITQGASVYAVDYRYAPNYLYPTALNDTIAGYKYLLDKGIEGKNILMIGDSAGGNLAFAVTFYLRDNKLPMPKAIIALSPWVEPSNDSESWKLNYDKDIFLGSKGVGFNTVQKLSYFKNAKLKEDPYASPILGNFEGFPNLLIQVGSYEILLDESKKVAEIAKKAGVNVKLTIYEKMSHIFQTVFFDIEETKQAWKEMEEFIKENML